MELEYRIIVFDEKHGRRHFLVGTEERLHLVALKILRERVAKGWIYEPDEPEKPAVAHLTLAQKEALPAQARRELEEALSQYARSMAEYRQEQTLWGRTQRALDTDDGRLAFEVIRERKDYEYEGWDFEYLEEP